VVRGAILRLGVVALLVMTLAPPAPAFGQAADGPTATPATVEQVVTGPAAPVTLPVLPEGATLPSETPFNLTPGRLGDVPDATEGESPAPAADIATIPSPDPSDDFLAITDTGWLPPDTDGAVGPNHLVIAVNGGWKVQNRSGGTLLNQTLGDFWAGLWDPNNLAGGSACEAPFDPRVLYDPGTNRWITVAIRGRPDCADRSAILFGTSMTANPNGAWRRFSLDADVENDDWADYPTLGFSEDYVVVSANMFEVAGFFSRSQVWALERPVTDTSFIWVFGSLDPNDYGFTMMPAMTLDNNVTTQYLVSEWNPGQRAIALYTLTGTLGNPPSLSNGPIAFPQAPQAWAFSPPSDNFAPQLGTGTGINTGDSRTQGLVLRNNRLWATHTVFPTSGPDRSAVQWWQLRPNGNVVQSGRIDDSTGTIFYAYPSIAVNADDDVVVGYSVFSPSRYAAAGYSVRESTDAPGTMRDGVTFKNGLGPYVALDGSNRNRWGDYSSTHVDPVDDRGFWTIQEYARNPVGPAGRWGTWWARIDDPSDGPGAGLACDFDGDGFGDAAIGVPLENQGAADAGVVLELPGSGGGPDTGQARNWHQGTSGVPDANEAGDQFSFALACGDFDGDGFSDLAVGANAEDVSGKANAGAVTILYGGPNGLKTAGSQQFHQNTAKIAGSVQGGDFFAEALASGDFNGDGYFDLAVGVPGENVASKNDAGAVQVFYGGSNGLRKNDWLVSQDTTGIVGAAQAGDHFGAALASGDFDGDGFEDLAVGIPGENVGGRGDAGAVHVVYGGAGGLSAQGDHIIHQNTAGVDGAAQAGDGFGSSLAAGTITSDGRADLVVGVPFEKVGTQADAGAVNWLKGSANGPVGVGANWIKQNSPGIPGAHAAGDLFGWDVAVGDVDGDGLAEIVVGIPGDNNGAGAINVIFGSGNGPDTDGELWSQDATGIAGTSGSGDFFGAAVTLVDIDGDDRLDVLVGVYGETIAGKAAAGAVNLIMGGAKGLVAAGDMLISQNTSGIPGTAQTDDLFGFSGAGISGPASAAPQVR